jgi:hypothetical protein
MEKIWILCWRELKEVPVACAILSMERLLSTNKGGGGYKKVMLEAVKVSTCGVCNPLKREAAGARGRDKEVMMEAVQVSSCGVCNPLQGEAVVYEWRLGEGNGEDLEVVLEAVKVSTCGVCNPLQGEADVYEWRLGESDGEDLEVMLKGEGKDLLLLPQGQGGHPTTRDHDDNSSLIADVTVKRILR